MNVGLAENQDKIIRRGIDHFGEDAQALKCAEEMNELGAVVIKDFIRRDLDLREKIIEELADVEVTLRTLKLIYQISDEEVNSIKGIKLIGYQNLLDIQGAQPIKS